MRGDEQAAKPAGGDVLDEYSARLQYWIQCEDELLRLHTANGAADPRGAAMRGADDECAHYDAKPLEERPWHALMGPQA